MTESNPTLCLRDVIESDLPVFFEHERDPQAVHMAAFTAKDPDNREAFNAHWARVLADPSVLIQTILIGDQVAGSVLSYEDSGHIEVSYWIGKEYWGKGIATRALQAFLKIQKTRPILARAAKDNLASIRVLRKCGFVVTDESKGFANARGIEIDELVLTLKSAPIIHPIRLNLPLKLGTVNCYLIGTGSGWILVDTGSSNQRAQLELELDNLGCKPGSLKLIVITHGDFDHTGNAAFLRGKYGAQIAMHPGDLGMLERGDMFFNRKEGSPFIRFLAPLLFGFGRSQRCVPDHIISERFDLAQYGLEAWILSIPGHSKGSLGILTAEGDLFCGDLLDNTDQPALNSIMDDPETGNASLERLKSLPIQTVYPGHGSPFQMELLSTK